MTVHAKEIPSPPHDIITPVKTQNFSDKGEVPFSFQELFFSRTDQKGIILAGNSVFQRISLYTWEELYQKPHNIIRHPDMPKGVFHTFWDFLKNGKPVGAYVKNKTKDGRHYWVFAIAAPMKDGYLSVRLKPSSDLFPVIQNAYKTLLSYEQNNVVSATESAVILLDNLKELGFSSYDQFMSAAIRKEVEARDKQLRYKKDPILGAFDNLTEAAQSMVEEVNNFFVSYEANKYVPLNLQIQSSQLGEQGKAIGVISGNYDIVSMEIRNALANFSTAAQEVFTKIYEGQFLTCTASIQGEVIEFFKTEKAADNNEQAQELNILQKQQNFYQQELKNVLQTIIMKGEKFQEDCRSMKMHSTSLEVIRVMGKVDVARLTFSKEGLHELMNDLNLFQESITKCLQKMDQINLRMKCDTLSIVNILKGE